DVEFDGRKADNFQVGAALRATQLVAFIDVELVDFDFRVAFGASGHSVYYNHAPMASTSVTTKTVVVADDTAFVRDRFRTTLEAAGHKAVTVKSAAELLARVRADLATIDLIVLDLRLPHAPGVDLVKSIRKMDDGKLPI